MANKRTRKRKKLEALGNYCAYCGSTENITLDHKKPRAMGGGNNYENLQLLCFNCNNLKGNMIIWNKKHFIKFIKRLLLQKKVKHIHFLHVLNIIKTSENALNPTREN